MLLSDPKLRITAAEALNHSFFSEINIEVNEKYLSSPQLTSITEKIPKTRKIIKF